MSDLPQLAPCLPKVQALISDGKLEEAKALLELNLSYDLPIALKNIYLQRLNSLSSEAMLVNSNESYETNTLDRLTQIMNELT